MTTSPKADNGLARKTRRGIGVNVVAAVATNAMRLGALIALGRLLEPKDFGVVAVAVAIMALLSVVKDVGVGSALVQRAEIDDGHVRAAFAISMGLATVLGVGLAAAAPLIAGLYHMPEATGVLRAMAAVFVINAVSSVSTTLCVRALEFKRIALIDFTGYTIGTGLSIACAVLGMGPWALVVGYLVEACLSSALYLYVRPPAVGWPIERDKARDLLGFGVGEMISQIASAIATQGDNLVVGRTLGREALGFYARAYDLVQFPAKVFTAVVGKALFPAFSRLQSDPVRLGRAYLRTLFANTLVLLPASMVLIVLAPEVVAILLGPGWGEMVWPFRILALGMLCRTSYKAGGIVARALGDVYAIATVVTIYAIVVVVGAIVASPWGITAVAATTTAAIFLAYVLLSYIAMRRASVGWAAFLGAHGLGVAIAAAVIAACWPLAHALRGSGVPGPLTVGVICIAGAAIALAMIAVGLRRGHADLVWLKDSLRDAIRGKRKPKHKPVEPSASDGAL